MSVHFILGYVVRRLVIIIIIIIIIYCNGLVAVFFVILLCSTIQCVCGALSSIRHYIEAPPPMDLVRVESNMSLEDDPRR